MPDDNLNHARDNIHDSRYYLNELVDSVFQRLVARFHVLGVLGPSAGPQLARNCHEDRMMAVDMMLMNRLRQTVDESRHQRVIDHDCCELRREPILNSFIAFRSCQKLFVHDGVGELHREFHREERQEVSDLPTRQQGDDFPEQRRHLHDNKGL